MSIDRLNEIKKELDSISDSLNDLNKKREWLYDDLLILFKEIPSIKSFTFYWTEWLGSKVADIENINGVQFNWSEISDVINADSPIDKLVKADISECEFKKLTCFIFELDEMSKDLLLIHCNKYETISLESIESANKDSLNIKEFD